MISKKIVPSRSSLRLRISSSACRWRCSAEAAHRRGEEREHAALVARRAGDRVHLDAQRRAAGVHRKRGRLERARRALAFRQAVESAGRSRTSVIQVHGRSLRKTPCTKSQPELSLHLKWQRQFVPAIRRASPGTQMVLATHSPEIVFDMESRLIGLEVSE